jgi:hypothetical protein
MKVLALTAAAVLFSVPAFAQALPPVQGLPPVDLGSVQSFTNAVNSATFNAEVTRLQTSSIRQIPAFNVPGGTAPTLSSNLASFFQIVSPP